MKRIQVLGAGCPKCKQVAANSKTAADELGVEVELEKVTDINDILQFGVMLTPGLVIDGEVKASGRVPGTDEIKQWLKD